MNRNNNTLSQFKQEMQDTLQNNILSFWKEKMPDLKQGGFFGQITGDDVVVEEANKGAVLNTRILWTFSAAYRLTGKDEYLVMATRAKKYILDHFYDHACGGIYWSLNYKGEPVDTKKQIYALGFAIYGLSEYHRATQDQESLDYAIKLYQSIEKYSFNKHNNGYCEALTKEWNEIADMRLSDKDANEKFTMNTHLHILEPYTNLYRVWKSDELKHSLRNLIELFIDKILNKETYHLELFFDEDWQSKTQIVSYGHDIEASWLIHEAAIELGDKELLKRVETIIPKIAEAAAEGIQTDGSMIYELNNANAHTDTDRHWWVQAETVVGYFNLYQHFNDTASLQKAEAAWKYIQIHFIDTKQGEWYWSIDAKNTILRSGDKAGFWKCPYHNSRMCMEIMERLKDD